MDQKYLDFLDKPAEKEYFTKFIGIYSRNMKVVLNNGASEYCDKIKIGETLEMAIKRSLRDDFGLELIDFDVLVFAIDTAINKQGETLSRIAVKTYVNYNKLKNDEVVGCKVSWTKKVEISQLAENRFSHEETLQFVEDLYNAGALDIENVEIEEGEYSDSIDVRLPKDQISRKKIFEIYNREQNREFPGEKAQIDEGQKWLNFWWD